MAKKATILGRAIGLVDHVSRIQFVWGGIAYATPLLVAIGAAVAGYVEHVPVMWIATSASLILFAGLGASWHLISIRNALTSMGKLRYITTMVAMDLVELKPGKTKAINDHVVTHRRLDKMQVGVQLFNAAHFDISAYIENANTSMDGHTPPRAVYPKLPVIVRPGQTIVMFDEPIDMREQLCKSIMGRLEMKIRYGAPGREKYDLTFNGRVEVSMRNTGVLVHHWTVWDAEASAPSQ